MKGIFLEESTGVEGRLATDSALSHTTDQGKWIHSAFYLFSFSPLSAFGSLLYYLQVSV